MSFKIENWRDVIDRKKWQRIIGKNKQQIIKQAKENMKPTK